MEYNFEEIVINSEQGGHYSTWSGSAGEVGKPVISNLLAIKPCHKGLSLLLSWTVLVAISPYECIYYLFHHEK